MKVLRQDWPSAELDPVRRLRIMASATQAVFADAVTQHSPALVWSVLSDLEGELPRLIPDIRTARIRAEAPGEMVRNRSSTSIDGGTAIPAERAAAGMAQQQLEVLALGYLGQRACFHIALEPGWCWMQSRFLLCGFAMTEEEGQTRYAFLGGFRAAGALRDTIATRTLHRPGQAYARWVTRRIERRVELRVRGTRE